MSLSDAETLVKARDEFDKLFLGEFFEFQRRLARAAISQQPLSERDQSMLEQARKLGLMKV